MTKSKTTFSFLKDGALYRRAVDGDQVIIPHKHRSKLLVLAHFSMTAGHPRSNNMSHSLRRRYCCPSMASDAYGVKTRCAACAKRGLRYAVSRRP